MPKHPWNYTLSWTKRGVPLGMHRMNPEYLGLFRDPSDLSLPADIRMKEEPEDEEEEDEEEHDGAEEDEDGDEGYSESRFARYGSP
jgi:hypothetical protein